MPLYHHGRVADLVLTLAHFHVEAWIDFVRHLEPEAVRTAMARHRSECQACHQLSRRVEDLAMTVKFDLADGAPTDVVERAVGLFDTMPAPPAECAPVARRILDFRMPGGPYPASAAPVHRLVFLAARVVITLGIERGGGADRVHVTGGLTASSTGRRLAASVSIEDDGDGSGVRDIGIEGGGQFLIDCPRGAPIVLHVHVAPPLGSFDVFFGADL